MKKSQLRNIIRESIKELMNEKQLLNEMYSCYITVQGGANHNAGGYSECSCGEESGACPTISVAGDCSSADGKFGGFKSCSKYCKGGCLANVMAPGGKTAAPSWVAGDPTISKPLNPKLRR
jgi:hypothetical protein